MIILEQNVWNEFIISKKTDDCYKNTKTRKACKKQYITNVGVRHNQQFSHETPHLKGLLIVYQTV